jgi:hypothetical protein
MPSIGLVLAFARVEGFLDELEDVLFAQRLVVFDPLLAARFSFRERDAELAAREYFDEHGRWPDEEPR